MLVNILDMTVTKKLGYFNINLTLGVIETLVEFGFHMSHLKNL
jgi:hypothetical protein